jgi:Cd2+/Zn2+-exporting ATPase
MTDGLDKVAEAIQLGRRTYWIIRQNIAMALGFKALVLILAVVGAAGIWQAVFADVGVAILTVFNSLRVILKQR